MKRPPLTPRRLRAVLGGLAGLAALGAAAGLVWGSVPIDLGLAFSGSEAADGIILFRTRLPRVLLSLFVGAGLAASGAALQALLRNALASPDVIGVSGGASVGAVAALAVGGIGLPWIWVPLAAVVGAALTIALVLGLATVSGRLEPTSLLLVGVVVNTVASSMILLASSLSDALEVQGMLFWMAGSLAERDFAIVGAVAAGTTLMSALLWRRAPALNLLSLGEDTARALGVPVRRTRRATFVAAATIVALCVSASGIIGFVGLIVPHILRRAFGADLRLLIPASFLGGGFFLVCADLLARTVVAPLEIPVGVLTALSGGPFFLWLLRRNRWRLA